jgi:hypothetical protein
MGNCFVSPIIHGLMNVPVPIPKARAEPQEPPAQVEHRELAEHPALRELRVPAERPDLVVHQEPAELLAPVEALMLAP